MSKITADVGDQRREYRTRPLRRRDLDPDPVVQFNLWFEEAMRVEAFDANAMSLATVADDGQPSLRTVLLKYFDHDGFVFYANVESRKAREIIGNPRVALLFYWPELCRQVAITGRAERTTTGETLRYFMRRPRDSQLSAWVSHQSTVVSSRDVLEQKFDEMKRKFAKGEVPLPAFWGGYRVRPDATEFWQGRQRRLHDRFVYLRQASGEWSIERLAP